MAQEKETGLKYSLERLFLWEIMQGMWLTFKSMFSKPVTMRYPEERWIMPERFRGQVALVYDPQAEEKDLCVGCCLCIRVCPSGALDIISSVDPQTGKKNVDDYLYNMPRCIFCGRCVEICPVKALINTGYYELAQYGRRDLELHKKDMLQVGQKWKKERREMEQQGLTPQSLVKVKK